MNPQLRTNWAPLAEIPATTLPPTSCTRRRSHQPSGSSLPQSAGSEADKHDHCSQALWCLCHGGTIREAAAHSGLTEQQVKDIRHNYGIKYLVSNQKHQVDDGQQIGPWINSRLHQSGHQRYKNDFHSWYALWVHGLSVDEALHALMQWKEFQAVKARLIRDYPETWRKFARVDIARCYSKFASYTGPALVRKRTQLKVEKAVISLNKSTFATRELMPLLVRSKRHTQRALAKVSFLRKVGAKRGSRWEFQSREQAHGLEPASPALPIVTGTPGVPPL